MRLGAMIRHPLRAIRGVNGPTGETTDLSNPVSWLLDVGGGGYATTSGVTVTPATAHTLAAVHACVRLKAQTLAGCSAHLFERYTAGGRQKRRNDTHPVARLLRRPNGEMTEFQFWETMVAQLELRGNAYAEIERTGRGAPVGLWPIHPDQVQVGRIRGAVTYRVTRRGNGSVDIPADDMLHVRYMTLDGLTGLSPIEQCRHAIGLGMAANDYTAGFFARGTNPSGYIKVPNKLAEKDARALIAGWNAAHQGVGKMHGTALVDNGGEWVPMTIKHSDAQLLELMKFGVREVCRIYGVQPHKIGDLEDATFSNIEHQGIEFQQYTMLTLARRIETAVAMSLLTVDESSEYFVEFNLDMLARADMAARYEAYAKAIVHGIMNQNEIRDRENLNPVPGLDAYWIGANMQRIDGGPNAGVTGGEGGRNPGLDGEQETKGRGDGADLRSQISDLRGEAGGTPAVRAERGVAERRAIRERHRGAVRAGVARSVAEQVRAVKRILEEHLGPAPDLRSHISELRGDGKDLRSESSDVRGDGKKGKQKKGNRNVANSGPEEHGARSVASAGEALDAYFGSPELTQYIADEMGVPIETLMVELARASAGEIGAAYEANFATFIKETVDSFCKHHLSVGHNELRSLLREGGPDAVYKQMLERMEGWESTLPDVVSNRIVTQSDGVIARAIWQRAGVKAIKWHANAGACPMCERLNGMVVSLEREEAFVPKGTNAAEGLDGVAPLWAGASVLHPPLHGGCGCFLETA